MLPKTLALIDDDPEYGEFLSRYLAEREVAVATFGNSSDLLAHPDAYAFDFYVVDLMLPGIDGIDLIKLLRRRSEAGIVVVSGRLAPDVFKQVIQAGADMYLAKPVQFEQVALAIEAVQRRASAAQAANGPWLLDRRANLLVTPDAKRVDLSDADVVVLGCFVTAQGAPVTRETLHHALGWSPEGDVADGLNATIYRLRRRIERATALTVPLQSKSRVGYVFRAPVRDL